MHLAPPCGTCSRAREKPVETLGDQAPVPLRDANEPLGFSTLTGRDKARVQSSNLLYAFCIVLLRFASERDIIISLENPQNSWIWAVFKLLVMQVDDIAFRKWFNNLESVIFSNCAWGGQRPKDTRWLSTPGVFSKLAKPCPGNHAHKPYGVSGQGRTLRFATAEEAEYPQQLCSKVVELLSASLGCNLRSVASLRACDLAAGQKQHKRHPPLVPEFAAFVTSKEPPLQPHKQLDQRVNGHLDGGGVGTAFRFGIFHTKEQFLQEAVKTSHPFDRFSTVDDVTRQNILDILTEGPVKSSKFRMQQLLECERMAQDLQEQQNSWVRDMPKHMQDVLQGKRLLFWKKLLEIEQYPDVDVCDFMFRGVDLVGSHGVCPLYLRQLVKGSTTPALLLQAAVWSNEIFSARSIHDGEPEMIQSLWDLTMQEVSKGFLIGPFASKQDLRAAVKSDHFVVNRRFLLLQGESNKPRAIDDCRSSGLNSAFD